MKRAGSPTRKAVALFCAVLLPISLSFAQTPAGPAPVTTDPQQGVSPQAAPPLSPDQLNNLVAPIALYPDPLLSQVLAASTYPLEIVEAEQWLGQHGNLQGAQLMEAAQQQNWDPSIQALVAFPDALRLLSNDIRWATALGDAFLAQQSDVMSAVQNMRARAQANGRLATTPAAGSHDGHSRRPKRYRDTAGRSASGLRSGLQSGLRVGSSCVGSVPGSVVSRRIRIRIWVRTRHLHRQLLPRLGRRLGRLGMGLRMVRRQWPVRQ